MGLGGIAERLTAKKWTDAEVEGMVGPHVFACVAHASDASVRERAASGGVVSALLVNALESGRIDGALVCVTSVEDGRVRARYRIATTREDVLAAQGSTYVLGDFLGEAIPLIRDFDGRLAVVALPCEITALSNRAALAEKVVLRIALFCGHTSEPGLIDGIVDKLSAEAGGATLVAYRFRVGHWRGRLQATFDNGTVVEKSSGYYNDFQNLYYFTPKKCIFCADHFGYDADLCAGDLWSSKYKDDPIKHTAMVAKTARGAEALRVAEDGGAIESASVEIREVLDGQRRVAPFHYNVTARHHAGKHFGMNIPPREGVHARWHERAAARMVVGNYYATTTDVGAHWILESNRRWRKIKLYVLKGLESLS